MHSTTFNKEERLSSKKLIDQIFLKGKSIQSHPVRLIWKEIEEGEFSFPAQVLFSVPKRNFKKAVHRNRIKRQMREIYRNNKSGLFDVLKSANKKISIAIIYTGRELPQFEAISSKINLTLERLTEELKRLYNEKL